MALCFSADEFKAPQIFIRPASLQFDYALQRFPLKGAAAALEDNGDSPSVGMVINLVGTVPSIKRKPVPYQGGGDFGSCGIPKLSIIDRHDSDGHRHARFNRSLDLIGGLLRDALSVLEHAPDDHTDELIDILDCLVLRLTPS